MSKHTTTLMEIIQSELQLKGFNEFVNDGKLTFDNQEYAFIQKVLRFDDDVKKIVDNTFFKGFRFNDERIDRYFKEAFTTRFLDREIGRQTVEAFASLVLYETIIREEYIYTVFGSELYKYLENHVDYKGEVIGNTIEDETQNQTSEENADNTSNETYNDNSTSKGSNTSDDREATSSLPQSEMNMNVDNDVLTFADDNTITKNKTITNDETNTNGDRDLTGNTKTNAESDTKRNSNQDTTSNQTTYSKTFLMENLEKLYSTRERIFNDYDRKCFLHIW